MGTAALVIDGLIIVLYFLAITTIGMYMGRKEDSLEDYALGGRRMPWWAVMASIIAAETSAATFLGAPGEGYEKRSLAYVQLVAGVILGRLLVGYLFLKPYYQYRVYTVYDYLGVRFGPLSKGYVSGLFLLMRTLASGTRLFVPSLVLVLAWRMFVVGGEVEFSQQAVTSVGPYLWAIVAITIITCLYTAVGGIKAVIWTDLIQASLMFGSALVAVVTLLYHIGGDSLNLMDGLRALGQAVPRMKTVQGFFLTGFEPQTIEAFMAVHGLAEMGPWDYVRLILENDYTLFSALIGATVINMAAFGTDQDMVQRLLTAQSYKQSRRSLMTAALMDVPIAGAFTFIGILLYVYYQQDPRYRPAANPDVFGSYILNVMPVVVRGFVLAGVFATAMGSLSAALNALATSATNDWYIKYLAPGRREGHYVTSARLFTALFAVLMIAIAGAFAYAKVNNPDLRIIPVVLGIASLILGPMLGVFLLGMLTGGRGSDAGNMLAITAGLGAVFISSGLLFEALNWAFPVLDLRMPAWMPNIRFTWFTLVGALATFIVGSLFRTPEHVLRAATRRTLDRGEAH